MRIIRTLTVAALCAAPGCGSGPEGPFDSGDVTRIELTPGAVSIVVDDSQALSAQAYAGSDHRVDGVSFEWASSNGAVVTVSQSGVVTGVATGVATVTARLGDVTGSAEVVVLPDAPQGQTIAVYSNVTYQTMSGWEASAWIGQLECDATAYNIYAPQIVDRAVTEMGINRLRLHVQSGIENPVDYFTPYANGTLPRDQWRAHWYEIINDNGDPFTLNPKGFQFARMDSDVGRVVEPIRQRLLARGEKLYVNLNYVDFGQSSFEHTQDVEEYAEFILAVFQHLKSKWGWVPDAVEISLEPDNTPNWKGPVIGRAIVATGDRLKAAGFTPDFIAPSNTSMAAAVTYFDQLVQVPRVLEYLTDLAYHRYSGVSTATVQTLAARAMQYGLRTAMLEKIGARYGDLHEDLKVGRNSAWQQYAIAGCDPGDPGGRHYLIDPSTPTNPVITMASRSKFLRQYFLFIRRGAVRIGAETGDPKFDPLAFRNTDGSVVVVVKAAGAGSFDIQGLPGGTYGLKYAIVGDYDVDLPDVTIAPGESVDASIPAVGVITIYQK